MQACKQARYLALAECGAVVDLVASGTLAHGLPAAVDTGLLQEGQEHVSVIAGARLRGRNPGLKEHRAQPYGTCPSQCSSVVQNWPPPLSEFALNHVPERQCRNTKETPFQPCGYRKPGRGKFSSLDTLPACVRAQPVNMQPRQHWAHQGLGAASSLSTTESGS